MRHVISLQFIFQSNYLMLFKLSDITTRLTRLKRLSVLKGCSITKTHFKTMQLLKLDAYDLAYAVVYIVAYAYAVAYAFAYAFASNF